MKRHVFFCSVPVTLWPSLKKSGPFKVDDDADRTKRKSLKPSILEKALKSLLNQFSACLTAEITEVLTCRTLTVPTFIQIGGNHQRP